MLFESLRGQAFGHLHMDDSVNAWLMQKFGRIPDENPILDPKLAQEFIEHCHRRLAIAHSYTPWFENRARLLRGAYLDQKGEYLHLGMDFNVPVGTPVNLDDFGAVVNIIDDRSAGGWGRRVDVRLPHHGVVLLYGHLAPETPFGVSELLGAGSVLGRVAPPTHNGGWWPHLHVQAVLVETYWLLMEQPDLLDGYGDPARIEELARQFPDPLQFVRLH